MSTHPGRCRTALDEARCDEESLTILVAAGASRAEVAAALGADLGTPIGDDYDYYDIDTSAYAIDETPGAVVAIDHSGYADPTLAALRQLTTGGRRAAVVRSNILAHYRFGCAYDGQVVFDDDEFAFLDPELLPPEVRDLAHSVHDLEGDVLATGLAMVEVMTAVRVSGADLVRVADSGYHEVPSMTYPGE